MKKIVNHLPHYFSRAIKHLRDHLVPHEGNNHHPHVLKHRVLVGYSVMLVLLKVLAIVMPVVLPSSSLYSSAITPQNIIDLTNQTRENLNLPKLKVNDKLMQAAAAKAQDMAQNQYFAHVSPAGVTPWSWMSQVGYKYKYAGENLAVHFTSAEGVQEGWLASPSHRANIVNKNYTEIGIGVAQGEFEGYPTTFVVQMFGTPAEATQVATTTPVTPTTRPLASPPPATPETPLVPPSTVAAVNQPSSLTQPESAPTTTILPAAISPSDMTSPRPLLPVLDETSVHIVPQEDYYELSLKIDQAESAVAYLGDDWVQLARIDAGSNVWTGHLPYDKSTANQSGESLAVIATSPDKTTARFALAWVAPSVPVQNFYTFNEGSERYAKLFGFITVHNLHDSIRQFYFIFMVFLAAALLINILVKVRVQKTSVLGHTIFVLILALFLSII